MKKILKICITLFLSICILLLVYVNTRLGYQPEILITEEGKINKEVLQQLYHLKYELHTNKAGEKMQQLYPEGFLFIHALYALTWYNVVKDLKLASPYYLEAIHEMNWVLQRIHSEESKSIFNEYLEIEYGAFYTGWSNLVLGRKLMLESVNSRKPEEIKLFQSRCEKIALFVKDSETPFAPSYSSSAWPADMTVCMSSLSIYDCLFASKYHQITVLWIDKVKQRLDTATGLIPHYVNAQTGYSIEGARGSSQSLMNCLLLEIDAVFANSQFVQYKKLFLDSRLGLPGIREYPKGDFRIGDIDSGPVIWGIGGAASVVGLHAMSINGEIETAVGLRNSIEGFGIGWSSDNQKRYLFGVLPIADAFIAWSSSFNLPIQSTFPNWRCTFLLYSIFASLVIFGILYWMWRKKALTL